MDRVKNLADRVEAMTFTNIQAEKIKNEFFNLCREYIDKKKVMSLKNQHLEGALTITKDQNEGLTH
jgi:hypothetical protein